MASSPPPLVPGPELSTTVFHGELESWRRHLVTPWVARVDGDGLALAVVCGETGHDLQFEARNGERSDEWARMLNRAVATATRVLEKKPVVRELCAGMLTTHGCSHERPLEVRSREDLPGPATREIQFDGAFQPTKSRIVIRTALLRAVEVQRRELTEPDDMEQLGLVWPVLRRIYLQLGYPNYPRDRFTERIDITTRWVVLNLHLLYADKKGGRLIPNRAGECFERFTARDERIDVQTLFVRQPFFRLMADLSFLLMERQIIGSFDTARIIVRDYLDPRYLRLSITGLMPGIPEWLQPMRYSWKGQKKIQTPNPTEGRYGILDHEDYDAWKKLRGPLAQNGYFLVRQLGMGQFGRVYEAINVSNSSIPQRVAIKVDRIRKGFKKEAIEAAESIMLTASGLSASPHMIRIFDAGKLAKTRATYHVMQLVEGDTLDNLLGITGLEHASVLRPRSPQGSEEVVTETFFTSISNSRNELWRRARRSFPFLRQPGLVDLFDLLVSKMLWVEEIHRLGFAVNDLKNGNVMITRRGQFKGIDLDAYSRIFSPLDKLGDFLFLSVATAQLLTAGRPGAESLKNLVSDTRQLRGFLLKNWEGEIHAATDAAPSAEDLAGFVCDFVESARCGEFSNEPETFTQSIDRLIALKRRLGNQEMVLE